jgi:hypothetical protein
MSVNVPKCYSHYFIVNMYSLEICELLFEWSNIEPKGGSKVSSKNIICISIPQTVDSV